ncbi:MAG: diguanylate cyclase [Thermodesulfovibrionales bacterium]|nr:diguanylate cyclase [Thermodesulfovibrionales bacterium]
MFKIFKLKDKSKRLINILAFRDLFIQQKFILFSAGALFWLVVIAAIGLVSLFEMNAKSQKMADIIVPQEKIANIVLRKLRGASISSHKIVIYSDSESINSNYIKGKNRLVDCRNYLNISLVGGNVMDYSRGTEQPFNDFAVAPLADHEKRKFVEQLISNINRLERLMDELVAAKLEKIGKSDALLNKLLEYDNLTRDIIVEVNSFAINIDKEWRKFTDIIQTRLVLSITLISLAFVISIMLSFFFGVLIARSLSRPVTAIIEEIKNLSSGEINLTKKLDVASKDELGILSSEFNKLMDSIERITSFKKMIEEDESPEDIYERLGKAFINDLELGNCVIYEVSNSKNNMTIVYPPEAEETEMHCKKEILLNCDLCRAKRSGHMISSSVHPAICRYYAEKSDDIYYCIPFIIGGNVGGVVQFVCGKRGICDITGIDKKISRARQYIAEAQPVLEAKRLMRTLKESTLKDPMTDLYNRRFIEEAYENLVAGILRRGINLGIMICDLDYFKQTNDAYGHDVGDRVLREAARNIKRSVRKSDLVIRFGGEEFLVILVDITHGDSEKIAEKIRKTLEAAKVQVAGSYIQKTISIGISEIPADTHNFWEAIKFADVALYRAKGTGRNKVVRFTSDMWAEEKY